MERRDSDADRLDAVIARVREGRSDGTFVVGQLGQSLDGRIATPAGDSQWINAKAALTHVHQLRAAVDAVVVGAGTIAADDPRLNVRRCPGENPARVVIDPGGRLADEGNWLTHDAARRVLIMRNGAEPRADAAARRADVDVIQITPGADGAIAPSEIVRALNAAGFKRLLIEGGANTVSRFIAAEALDRLHVLVAPLIIGSGPRGIELDAIERIGEARRPETDVVVFPDGDVLFDCDLRMLKPPLVPEG